jgi:hypothetical protein
MPSYESIQTRKSTLFTDGSNVPTATPVVSPWINVGGKQTINVTKKHTTGTYAATLEWSRDGSTVDFTTPALSLTDHVATVVTVVSPFVRLTITASVSNFTAHRTVVYG